MVTCVSLFRSTHQGAQTIDSLLEQFRMTKAKMAEPGGELAGLYLTQGQHDVVAIPRWPDECRAMNFNPWPAGQGNVRSETLRAFGGQEKARIPGQQDLLPTACSAASRQIRRRAGIALPAGRVRAVS